MKLGTLILLLTFFESLAQLRDLAKKKKNLELDVSGIGACLGGDEHACGCNGDNDNMIEDSTFVCVQKKRSFKSKCVKNSILEGLVLGDKIGGNQILVSCGCCDESLKPQPQKTPLLCQAEPLSCSDMSDHVCKETKNGIKINMCYWDVGDTEYSTICKKPSFKVKEGEYTFQNMGQCPSEPLPSQSPSQSLEPSMEPTGDTSVSNHPSFLPTEGATISSQPSSAPSVSPTLSAKPSIMPSDGPSMSVQPSTMDSDEPSTSIGPSGAPSVSPTLSAKPSIMPSDGPSMSVQPSTMDSDEPSTSIGPSGAPSRSPTSSAKPSIMPSDGPSMSVQPSTMDSNEPSTSIGPSGAPSVSPTLSAKPSIMPSDGPSMSVQPSTMDSDEPSTSIGPSGAPSRSPTSSAKPSIMPSDGPSMSIQPSSSPSLRSASILPNWDFEDELISPWSPNGSVTIAKSSEHAYSGSFGGLVTGITESWHGMFQYIHDIVQPDTLYEVSLWVKLVDVADGVTDSFSVNVHERTTDSVGFTSNEYPQVGSAIISNQWKKVTGFYQFSIDGRTIEFQKLYFQNPSNSFVIDEVVLKDATPIQEDVIVYSMNNTETVSLPQPPQPDLSVPRSNCPQTSPYLEAWKKLFSTMSENEDITLPEGAKVLVTETISTKIGLLTIPATSELIFDETLEGITMNVNGIKVEGSMIAGSDTCRYETSLTITLHGDRPQDITTNGMDPSYKGISVTGRLELHGKRYYRTWTKLAQRAHVGDNFLYLQDSVNWETGQEIVLVTSALRDSRDWHQNEIFQIASIDPASEHFGATVWLNETIKYDHIARQEYQVEVGLLSRMIKIQGNMADSEPTDIQTETCDLLNHQDQKTWAFGYDQVACPNSHLTGYGGHVMIHHGGEGYVEGIELFRMGQTNVLGRYPIHFHMLQDNCPGCYFKDSSVHRSFYRCISIHGTNNILVSENVGFDVIGYCYYLEDGVEERNTISYNLAAHIHFLSYPAIGSGQKVDIKVETPDLTLPADITASGFYITNLHNNITGNVAVGGWAGFAMPILKSPIGAHKPNPTDDNDPNNSFFPRERTILEFNGNTAHSTAHFWDKAAAFYFGGSIYFNSDDKLVYNAGRDNDGFERRNPCIEDDNGQCKRAWNRITNSKVFLVGGVGIGSWSGGMEVLSYECHDCGLAAEALVDGFWMDGLVAACRTGESLILPNQRADYVRANGFFWYDTGQEHIITSSTFRNCGFRSEEYDQYDTSETRGCNTNIFNGCGSGSTVFGFLTHSDEFNPELMQATKEISFDDVGRRFLFTTTNHETVSGRTQNWLDVDGSVTGLGEPTLIGSGFDSAGHWWKVDDDVFLDEQAPLTFIKQNAGPARGLAHIRLEWDDALHSTVGGENTCRNGGSGIDEDCPAVGHIRHLGSLFDTTNDPQGGLPVTIQPEIVGLAGGFGWLLSLDGGAPHTLRISGIEVMPNTPLLFSVAYPTDTTFQIKAKASDWCVESCDRSCEEIFTSVDSVQKVRHSKGNVYHFDQGTGLLTIRIIMFPTVNTGEPNWKVFDFDDKNRDGEYSLFRFERNGILLPKQAYPGQGIEIIADCEQDGAYCANTPPSTSAYDNVCSSSYSQVSYDKCCDSQNNCEDLGLIPPTPTPTVSLAPSAFDPEIITNGDFSNGVCPWFGVGITSPLSTIEETSGVWALSVTNRTNSWSGPRIDVTNKFRLDTVYTFSAKVKFVNNVMYIKMIVEYTDDDRNTNYKWVTGGDGGDKLDGWATFSTSFQLTSSDVSSTDIKRFVLYFETPSEESPLDFMIKDVSMTEDTITL